MSRAWRAEESVAWETGKAAEEEAEGESEVWKGGGAVRCGVACSSSFSYIHVDGGEWNFSWFWAVVAGGSFLLKHRRTVEHIFFSIFQPTHQLS